MEWENEALSYCLYLVEKIMRLGKAGVTKNYEHFNNIEEKRLHSKI